jgi:phosphoglycolate phosphatase
MINGVLFDLDGTLLDSAEDLVAALNHVRQGEGLEPVEHPAFRRYASRGALGLIEAGMPPSAPTVQNRRKKAFLDYYAMNSVQETRLFEGFDRVLDQLEQRGIPWGVVTNKIERLTLPILGATGLLSRAACVVCGDTLTRSKPHPAPVLLACELLGLAPENVLMVGDDLRDIQAGQAAGTRTAFAAYGYINCSMDEVAALKAAVFHEPEALVTYLDDALRLRAVHC